MRAPLRYWFRGRALFQVVCFEFSVMIIGLVALKESLPSAWYYALWLVGLGVTCWQWQSAAEQEQTLDTKDRQIAETNKLVTDLAAKFGRSAKLSVENLSSMSNSEMRIHVSDLAIRMRVFERGIEADKFALLGFPRGPESPEQAQSRWAAQSEAFTRSSAEARSTFAEQFLGDALALRAELCRRLGVTKDALARDHVTALDSGMLAGVYPISEAANQLEKFARDLPA